MKYFQFFHGAFSPSAGQKISDQNQNTYYLYFFLRGKITYINKIKIILESSKLRKITLLISSAT